MSDTALLTEQDRTDEFVRLAGGTYKADRMMLLWSTSYPSGTALDRLYQNGAYRSREDSFRAKAKGEGFSKAAIEAFLAL